MSFSEQYSTHEPISAANDQPKLTPAQLEKELSKVDLVAKIADKAKLEALVGAFLPEIGDVAGVLPSLYIVYKAKQLGASKWEIAKMVARAGVDLGIGLVPFIGDVIDFAYNSNLKNAEALRDYFEALDKQALIQSDRDGEKAALAAPQQKAA
ncbi:DUF4112 domain-containing protein [Candidatus Peregrinibacteria bacterium]|nr:MAG: DUF4112 domain-containing protein [Candidatus Peregrinibacteria bacterium]